MYALCVLALAARQVGPDVLVEPGFVPAAHAVDPGPVHLRLRDELAGHDDGGVAGEGDPLHAVVVGVPQRLGGEAGHGLVEGEAGAVGEADVGPVRHHAQRDQRHEAQGAVAAAADGDMSWQYWGYLMGMAWKYSVFSLSLAVMTSPLATTTSYSVAMWWNSPYL